MIHQLEDIYLDWVNNYVSVEKFASGYDITKEQALELLKVLTAIRKGETQ